MIYVVLQTLRHPQIEAPNQDEGVDDLFNEPDANDPNENTDHDDLEVMVLGTSSTLDQANKCAGFAFLDHQNTHLGTEGNDGILRKENKSEMRKLLTELEEVDQPFEGIMDLDGGSKIRIWVEEKVVSGPRN